MTEENLQLALTLVPFEIWNTFYMVMASALLSLFFGIPLGVLLTITGTGHLKENKMVYTAIGTLVNMGRSFPFVILMVAIIPLTRFIAGTTLGTNASIVPLTIAAIPFVARQVEASLKEIEKSLLEAAVVMGSSTWRIITKVMFPEAFPGLILGFTTTVINLIGYSAMAGTMGGGGLGKIAIQYGYQRFNTFLVVVTVILLIILVQGIQALGNLWADSINKKRGKGYIK